MLYLLLRLEHHQVTKHLDGILNTMIGTIVILLQPFLHWLVVIIELTALMCNLFMYSV